MNAPTDRLFADSAPSPLGRADLIALLAIAATFIAFGFAITNGRTALPYDALRDTAYCTNILAGRIASDPCLPDEPYWYAPGSPLLMAGVCRLTGWNALEAYSSSRYWLSVFTPLLVYLLARRWLSRSASVAAVLLFWLGSYWQLATCIAPMPSTHGFVFNLLALLAWDSALRRGTPGMAILTGLILGAGVWHHPPSALIAAGAIGLHALTLLITARSTRRYRVLRQILIAGGLCGVIAAPLIWHVAGIPKRNLTAFHYFAIHLTDPNFFAQLHAPLAAVLGWLGVFAVWKTLRAASVLLAYLAVGIVGQVLGYLGGALHWPVPYLLPHEFQAHAQLALALCGAVALDRLARYADRRATSPTRFWLPYRQQVAFVLIFAVGPALLHLRHIYSTDRFPDPLHYGGTLRYMDEIIPPRAPWLDWLANHTDVDAVVACDPQIAHFLVCGTLGRKTVLVPPLHCNPAINYDARLKQLATLFTTDDPQLAAEILQRYRVDYLLLARNSRLWGNTDWRQYQTWPFLRLVAEVPFGGDRLYAVEFP